MNNTHTCKEFSHGEYRVEIFPATDETGPGTPNVFVRLGEGADESEVTGCAELGQQVISDLILSFGSRPDAKALAECSEWSDLDKEWPVLAGLMRKAESWLAAKEAK